jgi:hypothetical protein
VAALFASLTGVALCVLLARLGVQVTEFETRQIHALDD